MDPGVPAGGVQAREIDADAALLGPLRAGSQAAFEELVRLHSSNLYGVVYRLLRNDDDAAEALQDTFLSAFRALPGFEGKSRLGTWLHRIAVNAALMKLRARSRCDEGDVDELLPEFWERGAFVHPQGRWEELPEDDLERQDLAAWVRGKIDELPDKFRIPLVLRDIEGLTNEELASELGLTLNAAKVRVHRARQAVRALVEPRLAREGT